MISVLSVVFVILVLLFTFQSVGLPVLLILIIQGSILFNFSFPGLTQSPIFFLSYLIVTSIQMGANIDYAIVISSWYKELKTAMPPKKAIVKALELSFPTVLTSGSILASAGFLIGKLSTEGTIVGIGECLSRGTFDLYVPGHVCATSDLAVGRHHCGENQFSRQHAGGKTSDQRHHLRKRTRSGDESPASWTPTSKG